MEKLEKWVDKVHKNVNVEDLDYLSNQYFFRDPQRPQKINSNYFYSPADGIVLYSKVVNAKEKILDVKGINYNLQNLLHDEEFDEKCLVIGIFMSFYDVHINRMPIAGILSYEDFAPLKSYNYPMLFTEKEVMAKKLQYNKMEYAVNNERRVNYIYSPQLDYWYYLVQIADDDINVIMHFNHEQEEHYSQNERFSFIRWGSQVELILPLDKRFDFCPLTKPKYHVEAGIDKIIEIKKINNKLIL